MRAAEAFKSSGHVVSDDMLKGMKEGDVQSIISALLDLVGDHEARIASLEERAGNVK
jgi:hypothetical protein